MLDSETKKVVGIIDRVISEKAIGHDFAQSLVSVILDQFWLKFRNSWKLDLIASMLMQMGRSQWVNISSTKTNVSPDIVLSTRQRLVPVLDSHENLVGVISRADAVDVILREPARFPAYLTQKKSLNVSHLAKSR